MPFLQDLTLMNLYLLKYYIQYFCFIVSLINISVTNKFIITFFFKNSLKKRLCSFLETSSLPTIALEYDVFEIPLKN